MLFNSQFITASPVVQSDCNVYSSAGNSQGLLLLFLFLHLGRYSDEESVKEKWDFGTSWNWCEMKILMKLSSYVKTVPCCEFGTICTIWRELLVLVKLQITVQPSLK